MNHGQRRVSLERKWRSRLERHRSSGLKVSAFCRQEGVSTPSFYKWRSRLAHELQRPAIHGVPPESVSPAFFPVTVAPSTLSIEHKGSESNTGTRLTNKRRSGGMGKQQG